MAHRKNTTMMVSIGRAAVDPYTRAIVLMTQKVRKKGTEKRHAEKMAVVAHLVPPKNRYRRTLMKPAMPT